MAVVLLFASAREAVGTGRIEVSAPTVGQAIAQLVEAHQALADLLPTCAIWLNGDRTNDDTPITAGDEVAVLPPVSGG
ncbi:MAG TPA: MoaD/ThiS family protein [Ilumatobacteraceae bacterium]|nr:MoaD/ThiS family protein [Ilumatobacteraceae bacterium]